jgi:hypothetical protein
VLSPLTVAIPLAASSLSNRRFQAGRFPALARLPRWGRPCKSFPGSAQPACAPTAREAGCEKPLVSARYAFWPAWRRWRWVSAGRAWRSRGISALGLGPRRSTRHAEWTRRSPGLLSLLLCCVVFSYVCPSCALGRTLVVDASGGGDYSSIQEAVDAASTGDSVVVRPGRYLETISIVGKDIHLASSSGPSSTIIDGNGNGPVIHCLQMSTDSSIQGFTITGGITGLAGGGIYLVSQASPLIRGNIIVGNRAQAQGAASSPGNIPQGMRPGAGGREPPPSRAPMYCEPTPGSGGGIFVHYQCLATIVDNVIMSNEASRDGGGVVFWDHANGRLERNKVLDNVAGRKGGGVFVGCNAAPTLEQNIIARNRAMFGAGVHIQGFEADAIVRRNTFYENSASSGAGGIQCEGSCVPQIVANLVGYSGGDGILCDPSSDPFVSCNVIWASTGDDFDGDCFGSGVIYTDLDNDTEAVDFCSAWAGDFRPCAHPRLGRCGLVGAEDLTCGPGECGVTKGSWGLIKALYR